MDSAGYGKFICSPITLNWATFLRILHFTGEARAGQGSDGGREDKRVIRNKINRV